MNCPSRAIACATLGALFAFAWQGVYADPTPRSRSEVRAFRADHPCPATGKTRGACPGWHVDHIVALCAGGPDKPANMQWITREDHRFKTLVDVRECRKLRRLANTPAR